MDIDEIWRIWPELGRRRTEGRKPNSRNKLSQTPKERCQAALDVGLEQTSAELILNAAKRYVENTEPQFVVGLQKWLEECRWENEDVATEKSRQFEPPKQSTKNWKLAEGQVKTMLGAMSAEGCPDDVLDGLFGDGIGVTHVNAPKGMPPTPVLRTNDGFNLFYRAASGFAKRAGYNDIAYGPEYVRHAREKRAQEASSASI